MSTRKQTMKNELTQVIHHAIRYMVLQHIHFADKQIISATNIKKVQIKNEIFFIVFKSASYTFCYYNLIYIKLNLNKHFHPKNKKNSNNIEFFTN